MPSTDVLTSNEMAAKLLPRKSAPSALQVIVISVVFIVLVSLLFFIHTSAHFFVQTASAYNKASRYHRHKGTVMQDTHTQPGWWETSDAPAPCDAATPLFLSGGGSRTFSASCDPTLTQLLWGSQLSLGNITSRSTTCPRELGPNPIRLPSTGLKSWPGSGNTWTRHLIQQLTGIVTGSIYSSVKVKDNGYLKRTTDVIVVKSHNPRKIYQGIGGDFDRQVLLLRNPFDAFAAEYKRGVMGAGHTKHVNITPDDNWEHNVRRGIKNWPYFVYIHMTFQKPQLIILYEDMRSCLLRELLRLSNFLRWGKMKYFSACCTLRKSQGRAYRNQGRVPVYELYTGKLLQDMNDMLTTLAKNLSLEYPVLAKRLLDYRHI